MWRLHRYYIKELFFSQGLTFLTLFGVSFLALIARGLSSAQGVNVVIALWITLLYALEMIPHLLSITVLVASVFTFGRAAADNEITAMRMAGTSPLRLMGAVLFVGAVTATVNVWILHDIIPLVHYHKHRPAKSLITQFLINNRSRQNKWEFDRLLMTWERREGQRYHGTSFRAKTETGRYSGEAREVSIESDPTGELLLVVGKDFKGHIETDRFINGELTSTRKRVDLHEWQLTFKLREILERGRRQEGLLDMSTSQLVAEINSTPDTDPEGRWLVWLRTCQALSTLLLAIIGFPIGVVWQRAGRMASLAISFVPIVGYYGVLYGAQALAHRNDMVLPVLLPNVALAITALFLTRKAFRQ